MQEKIREIEEGKFKLGFWITELLNFQSLTNANYERMIPKSTLISQITVEVGINVERVQKLQNQ